MANDKPNMLLHPIRRVVAEMTGKVGNFQQNGFWLGMQRIFNRGNTVSINYERNNYDLFRSIYHNSIVNGKGEEYQIAAALGKPIVNITAGFVIGRGCTIALDNPSNLPMIQTVEDDLNKYLKQNQGMLFNAAKHSYRDGDAYVHMDEFGKLTELDAKGIEVILDPISGAVMGVDVKNIVYINDTDRLTGLPTGTQATWIYVKQYRMDSIRIYRFPDGQPEKAEVLWEKVFTADGVVSPADVSQYDEAGNNLGIPVGTLEPRKLAIKALHNEPEPQAVYGNSDYQNVLAIFRDYADVIKEAKGSVIYNASPIPVLKGVVNPRTIAAQSAANDPAAAPAADQGQFVWGKDKILYLNGDKADAKMLQGNNVMDDAAKLLEIYFYLFVQGSETPEFVFGTAVSSSKASTETQIPIFVKKIERKQEEFSTFVKDLVETYIERRILISDPLYLSIMEEVPAITVNYPPIDDEDKQMILETVTFAFESKFITAQTALELILGDKIKNVSEEIKRAAAEAKAAAKEAAPEQTDRLTKALLEQAKTKAPVNEPTPPAEA